MISSQRTTILYQLISNLKLKLTDTITNFSSCINVVIDLAAELVKYKPFLFVLVLIIFQFSLYDFDINEYIRF